MTTMTPQLTRRKYRMAIDQFSGLLSFFRWWILAIVIVVILAATITGQFITLDSSWWGNLLSGARFAVAIMAGVMVYEYIATATVTGVTRREFGIAQLWCNILLAMALAVLATVGLVIEHLIFSAAGWTHPSPTLESDAGMNNIGEVLGSASLYFVAFPFVVMVGFIIGCSFYRNGILGSVLIIPVLFIAITLQGTQFDNSIVFFGLFNVPPISLPLVVASSIVFTVLFAWLAVIFISNSDIRNSDE